MRDRDLWAWCRVAVAAALVLGGTYESMTGDALVGFVVIAVGVVAAGFEAVLARIDDLTAVPQGKCPEAFPTAFGFGDVLLCDLPFGHAGTHEDAAGTRWQVPPRRLTGAGDA
jgi:hypothetical protein